LTFSERAFILGQVAGERFSIIDAICSSVEVWAGGPEGTHVNGGAFGCGHSHDVAGYREGDVRGDVAGGCGGERVKARVQQTNERLEGLKALLQGSVISQEEHDAQRAVAIAAL
jgi:hypothetical protein